MTTSLRQLRRSTRAGILLAGAALALTACGSSSTAASPTPPKASDGTTSAAPDAGLTTAQALAAMHAANPTKIGITKPIGAAVPTGKSLVYISCGAAPCNNTGKSLEAAAAVLGWKVKTLTVGAAGTAQAIQDAFTEAVRLKPDGVAYLGLPTAAFQRQLTQLEAMKIPVAAAFVSDPLGGALKFTFVNAETVGRGTEILAAKTIADSAGKAHIGIVNITNYPVVAIYKKAYEEYVKANCPGCSTKALDLAQDTIGKDSPASIVNFVRANPGMDTLFLTLDDFAIGLPAALKNAGLADKLKIYSWAPTEDGLAGLANGARTASVPTQQAEGGWYLADAFARIFSKQEPVAVGVEDVPWVIWAKDTAAGVPTDTKNPSFVVGYQDQFKALWGK